MKRKKTPEDNAADLADQAGRRKLHRQNLSTEEIDCQLPEGSGTTGELPIESDAERIIRLNQDKLSKEFDRSEESQQERETRISSDRLRHQAQIKSATPDAAEVRRRKNAIQTACSRAAEDDIEAAQRREEDRLRQARRRERLRLQREETENLARAMAAENHAVIVPLVSEEELAILVESVEREEEAILVENVEDPIIQGVESQVIHMPSGIELIEEKKIPLYNCGPINVPCVECDALHFKKERPRDKMFSTCCAKGKVILLPAKECPELLLHLYKNSHPKSSHFRQNVRNYNSALAMASMNGKINVPRGRGPYCFQIHGQVYHDTSPVGQENVTNHRYAQLYFLDSESATDKRLAIRANGGCEKDLMKSPDGELRQVNPYALLYKNMARVLEEEKRQAAAEGRTSYTVGMVINGNRKINDQRRYNRPTSHEIAVVFKSVDGAPPVDRSFRGYLLIPTRGTKFIKIDSKQPMCDPMTYPLLFPNGDDGWHPFMPYSKTTRMERNRLRMLDTIEEEEEQEQGEENVEEPQSPNGILETQYVIVEQGSIIHHRDGVVAEAADNTTIIVEQERPVIEDELGRQFSAVEHATRMRNRIGETGVMLRRCFWPPITQYRLHENCWFLS